MKTPTELYNKHFRGTDYEGQFEEALAEHDKEIIQMIDDLVKSGLHPSVILSEIKKRLSNE